MAVGVLLGGLLGMATPQAPLPVQSAAPNDRLGLAHVDLMDLHVERLADGGLRDRELLPPADLADRFTQAAASGAPWNRWSLYWDMVERSGRFDWAAADGIVGRDVGAGLRTLAILQGTPVDYATGGLRGAPVPAVGGGLPALQAARARRSGAAVQASPPRGLEQPIFRRSDGSLTDDPAEAAAINPANPWARFVDLAVRRYRPGGELAGANGWPAGTGVRAWEIGNEPNLAHFWSGTPAQFARYLEVAYLVIERADPAATVLHGGIADDASATPWYNQLLDALKARAGQSPLPARYGYYFDAAAWHWYTYPSLLQTGPEKARGLLAAKGLPAKPVWVSEMGVPIWSEHPGPCWDPTSPWRATTAEQAGYVWQALAEGLAAAVERLIFFQHYDDCGNGPASYDAFGLVRNHASNQCWQPPTGSGQACWRFDPALAGMARPAYGALDTAAEEMNGVELLWRPPREEAGWQRVLFYRPPDHRVMLLWNTRRADQTVEVYGTGPEATVLELDAAGTVLRRTAVPTAGRHSLTLPGATNRNNPGNQSAVMAGRPVMVVERDAVGPFRAQVEALPELSPPRLALTVSAADGGTGVGAFRVMVSRRPPESRDEWLPIGPEQAWPAAPLSGQASVEFVGQAGQSYHFAAQARDRAGNWSTLPLAPQASTRIEGTPQPTEPIPTVEPSPTGPPPTDTPVPEPTATIPRPIPVDVLWVPLALRGYEPAPRAR